MKYSKQTFNREVHAYVKALKGKVEKKLTFITLPIENKIAFYSLAPLSAAIHNLEGDMHVLVISKENRDATILQSLWDSFDEHKAGAASREARALAGFIGKAKKKIAEKDLDALFARPDLVLAAGDGGFEGSVAVPYRVSWHVPYRWNELLATAERVLTQGYALKRTDRFGIGFELIPSAKTIELPLEDYLDSYAMARAFTEIALKKGSKVSLAAVTMRASRLDDPVRTMDVLTTLRGCEIEKDIPEPVFRAFRTLSQAIGAQRLTFNTAAIHIHGKGYFGKHLFGESIGYPTKNRKSRWTTPGEMMLKDRYSPQTFIEDRDPMMRYALTETLPLDIFIETCNLDYAILKKRSDAVRDVLNRCDYLLVKGNKAKKGAKTDLRVDLIRKTDNHRRMFTSSDCDVRYMIDKDFYKETGKKAGNYANFPSGETFTTPEKVTGTLVGDVVINIDRSRVIPKNRPLIVHFSDKGRWTLNDGPEDIRKKMEKEIAEGLKRIEHLEKQRSLPKSMTDMYRENIDGVGEFAVNTNPKAKLCDYLIVNEKIAGMIHLALGMGFETDKKTVYHWDIVINAPEQEIDIYGFDKKGREQWVMKQGKLVV